jgi:hypothetical protein
MAKYIEDRDDGGHIALFEDISELLEEVKEYQFHDFGNSRYPAPKMALVEKLEEIRNNVIQGLYDNRYTE